MDAIALAIPFFFLLMGLELAWSAWSRSRPGWSSRTVYRFNDFIANMGCGIGSQIVGAFTKTMIFAAYLWTFDNWRLFTLPNTALTWMVAFVAVDMLYYWFHRLSHEVNFLWAAHVVHHQSEEYNLSVALRQSWWQGLFSWWFYLPLAMLGVHPVVIVTVGAVNTLYQFWIHTKAIDRMGPLEWVFNTPSHHRVHHGSDPKYIDRNHAGTLIVWDKLFGTFQREEEEPVYGITTPLRTWDPLTANFSYWGELIQLARRSKGWRNKVLVFLKPPGWRPQELGGRVYAEQKDRDTHTKFETEVPRSWTFAAALQFIALVAVTSFFLFQQHTLSTATQWMLAVVILWWVMELGVLMNGQRWALLSGTIRSVLLIGITATIGLTMPHLLVMATMMLLMLPFIPAWRQRPTPVV
ncbi:MAG: sterol desaturase family protein [Flavobacteriales bacterium]|nr:sterol desaturase family protein [Flavobacteriales bacterium]